MLIHARPRTPASPPQPSRCTSSSVCCRTQKGCFVLPTVEKVYCHYPACSGKNFHERFQFFDFDARIPIRDRPLVEEPGKHRAERGLWRAERNPSILRGSRHSINFNSPAEFLQPRINFMPFQSRNCFNIAQRRRPSPERFHLIASLPDTSAVPGGATRSIIISAGPPYAPTGNPPPMSPSPWSSDPDECYTTPGLRRRPREIPSSLHPKISTDRIAVRSARSPNPPDNRLPPERIPCCRTTGSNNHAGDLVA